MEFRELKTFQVVASLLSFNKAADVLNYAQSTVSSQIKALEHDLGNTLFTRMGNRIELTKAGMALLEYSQKVINIEKEIRAKISDIKDPYGSISIKAPQSVSAGFLPEVFGTFHVLFPNVNLDIDWCAHYSLKQAFQSDVTDIAFLITDEYSEQTLHTLELCQWPLSWVVNPAHPLALKQSFALSDIKDQLLIVPKSDCSYRLNLQRAMLEAQIEPRMELAVNSLEAIKQMIFAGRGIALISTAAVQDEIESKKLFQLNWEKPEFATKLYMIWKKDKFIPPPVETFIALVGKFHK